MRRDTIWIRGYVYEPHTCCFANHLCIETENIVNEENGGYENVKEYIPIGQPNAGTLAKLQALEPSTTHGDRELPIHFSSPLSLTCHI